jgi:hypothetical protein
MGLALFNGCNYVLRRESPKTQREFVQHGQGKVTTGWEMMVPPRDSRPARPQCCRSSTETGRGRRGLRHPAHGEGPSGWTAARPDCGQVLL